MNKEFNNNRFLAKGIPCKRECEDRTPGCHDSCQKYIDWKYEKLKQAEIQRKERAVNSEAIEQIKKVYGKKRKRK